jgi:hypothetical protein
MGPSIPGNGRGGNPRPGKRPRLAGIVGSGQGRPGTANWRSPAASRCGAIPGPSGRYDGDIDHTRGSWPVAERVEREAFVLLVHPTEEEPDLRDAADAVAKVAEAYRA